MRVDYENSDLEYLSEPPVSSMFVRFKRFFRIRSNYNKDFYFFVSYKAFLNTIESKFLIYVLFLFFLFPFFHLSKFL